MADPSAKVDVAIGVHEGKVVARWHEPTAMIVFDPQNAFQVAEAMARAAHEARFPGEKLPDTGYLASQIKSRLTEEMRDRLIIRCAHIVRSMVNEGKTPGQIALQVVEVIFKEVA